MKLGNTSQSRVPVPDFFLNKNLKQLETFEISEGKPYFREKDLFRNTKDLNFCNNPRNFNRKYEKLNRDKYLPDLTNINSILKIQPKSQTRQTFIANNLSPKANTYNNFRSFVEKTNISNFTNPDLRNEIRSNINILINKISDVYDLEKWGHTDTRANFLQTNSEIFNNSRNRNYLNENNFHNNSNFITADDEFYFKTKRDMKKFVETDADRFKTILKQKVNNMSIEKSTKYRLMKNFDKFNDSSSDKFYKPKATNIIAQDASEKNLNLKSNNDKKEEKQNLSFHNTAENKKTKNFNMTTNSNNDNNYNTTVNYNNTKNNLNNLNNTNFKTNKTNYSSELIDINDNFNIEKLTLPAVATKYSTVNPNFEVNLTEVDKLRKDNKKLYQRFKETSLFKDFPSPDRKEFVVKKGEKLRNKSKKDRIDRTLLDFSGYNASKHRHIFCEDYDTNDSVMVKFKKSKEVF